MKLNKKVMITISSVAIASVLGFGIYHTNAAQAQPKLSTDEIKELVSAQYPGTITEVEVDKGFNKVVYEVEVESDGKEYEIKLDGNTGEVLKLEEKEIREAKQNTTNVTIKEKNNADDKVKADKVKNDDAKDDGVKEDKTDDNKKVVISKDEAKKIALAEFDGTIKELDLDEDDDRLIYEIEIESANGEAEMDIDAYTGEIISISIDRVITDTVDKNKETENPKVNNPATSDPAKSDVNDDDLYDDNDDDDIDGDNDGDDNNDDNDDDDGDNE